MEQMGTRCDYQPLNVRSFAAPSRMSASHARMVRPPLFGAHVPGGSWGHAESRKRSGYLSTIFHLTAIVVFLGLSSYGARHEREVKKVLEHVTLIAPSKDAYMLPVAHQVAHGGGGGGEREKIPAPQGRLPKLSLQQITPPAIVVRNEHPKLAVQPTVVAPPKMEIASTKTPHLGDPAVPAMPSPAFSNGTGSGGGIGSGSGGGVGKGTGPGIGEGRGGEGR